MAEFVHHRRWEDFLIDGRTRSIYPGSTHNRPSIASKLDPFAGVGKTEPSPIEHGGRFSRYLRWWIYYIGSGWTFMGNLYFTFYSFFFFLYMFIFWKLLEIPGRLYMHTRFHPGLPKSSFLYSQSSFYLGGRVGVSRLFLKFYNTCFPERKRYDFKSRI